MYFDFFLERNFGEKLLVDSDTCRLMAAWWTTRVDAVHRYNHTSAMSRLSRAGREIEILPDPTENGPGTIQPGTLSNSVTIIHLQPPYRRLSRKIGATPPAPPPPTHTHYTESRISIRVWINTVSLLFRGGPCTLALNKITCITIT